MTSTATVPAPVVMMERKFRSKANKALVTERLYQVAQGVALGARKGGAFHLSDGTNWEVFTLYNGIGHGNSVGFVDDDTLARAVTKLRAWAVES